MKVLIIAPLHDYPTTLSSMAVSRLVKWMKENDINYTLLRSLKANRLTLEMVNYFNRKFSERFDTERFSALFYYGHGEEDRLGDSFMDYVPLISPKNIHKFKDMIIYTMACLSGKELAHIAIEKGVKSYFGQTVRYFASLNNLGNKYDFLEDWFELINTIPIRLMSGDTAYGALRKYEKLANERYAKYLRLKNELNLDILYSNARHLELFGKHDAKII